MDITTAINVDMQDDIIRKLENKIEDIKTEQRDMDKYFYDAFEYWFYNMSSWRDRFNTCQCLRRIPNLDGEKLVDTYFSGSVHIAAFSTCTDIDIAVQKAIERNKKLPFVIPYPALELNDDDYRQPSQWPLSTLAYCRWSLTNNLDFAREVYNHFNTYRQFNAPINIDYDTAVKLSEIISITE